MGTREKILAKALELWAARGYENVGVQEIVEVSQITKPSLYHYFGSKGGLLTALITDHFDPFLKDLPDTAHYNGELPQALERVTAAYFHLAKTDKTFYRVLLALIHSPPESESHQIAAKFTDQPLKILEQLFQEAAKDHGNMQGRHPIYALTLIDLINNYITLYLESRLDLNEELRRQVLRQYMYGIYS